MSHYWPKKVHFRTIRLRCNLASRGMDTQRRLIALQQRLVGIETRSLHPWDQLSEDAKAYYRYVVRHILTENVDTALQRAGDTVD